MGTKQFDGIIRKKLESVEAPAHPGSWEAFRKKLEEAPPVAFDSSAQYPADQVIAQKLENAPVPGSPESTWPLLEKRLRDNAILRERVFFYKSLELCLVLFFTALAWQWANPSAPPTPSGKNSTYRQAPIASEKSSDYRQPFSTQRPSQPKSAKKEDAPVQQKAVAYSNIKSGITTPIFDTHNAPLLLTTENNAQYLGKPLEILPISGSFPVLTSDYSLPVGSSAQIRLPWQVPTIAVPSFKPLPLTEEDREEGVFTLKDPPKRALLNVAMLGSSDFNRVMTPPDYRFRINAFDQYSLGYGGGLIFGLEYGRMEIGAGLIYAAKQYRPLPVIFIKGNFRDGYVGESLQTVQLNMINLPVYLRYDALRKDKWRAYVSGGASLQVAFEANYFFAPPTSFPADLAQTPAGQSRLRNRTEGWFEGGAFEENSYVTANLAVGVERFVSERWGLFLQPTYHRSIGYFSNGLGPNLDRIHTFSIWTGIRVRVLD